MDDSDLAGPILFFLLFGTFLLFSGKVHFGLHLFTPNPLTHVTTSRVLFLPTANTIVTFIKHSYLHKIRFCTRILPITTSLDKFGRCGVSNGRHVRLRVD
ncbi:putative protein transport protein yip1 [Glarea lozoyensis 74030]|uniref:Uncharacterized protein n=1 Tax=Glarea lozoyensis (strain ATCC 74030 / MF5533) TaxID=1104152 RepID=H0EIJ1_GLAL7|nr:putative protein transport protein yip1 [Glarea lozoyensis 74030]